MENSPRIFSMDVEHLSRQDLCLLAQTVGTVFHLETGLLGVAVLGTTVDLVSLRRGRGAVMSSPLSFLLLSPPPQNRRHHSLIGSRPGPEFQSQHLNPSCPDPHPEFSVAMNGCPEVWGSQIAGFSGRKGSLRL